VIGSKKIIIFDHMVKPFSSTIGLIKEQGSPVTAIYMPVNGILN
jgi:hypothetical protein